MAKPRIAIITGYGINSDYELCHSFKLAGGEPRRVHINDFIEGGSSLADFDILAIPGGFSFGDHLGSGRVFANKLKSRLGEALAVAVDRKMPILGICNGFQVLVKLGLLPGVKSGTEHDLAAGSVAGPIPAASQGIFMQTATLTYNDSGKFEDRWCHLTADPAAKSLWIKGITSIYLPIRHGEGKFVPRDAEALAALKAAGQVCLRYSTSEGTSPGAGEAAYPFNPNGSVDNIAAVSSADGLIFGLMPHPEAHMLATHHPQWQKLGLKGEGEGMKIFRNAVEYVQG